MMDSVLSRQGSDLYQRLLAGEYHMLEPSPATSEKMDAAERELTETGFARIQDGNPPLLVPVAPAAAAQLVLGRLTAQMSSWQDQTASAVRQLIELQRDALSIDGRPVQALAEVVTKPAQILALVDDLQRDARRELLSLDTTASAGSACLPRISPAIENPPPVWQIVYTADFLTPELTWILDETLDHGGEVRVAPTLPMKLLIADRTRALVPLDKSGSAGVVLFRAPTVVSALTEFFLSQWDRATPYPADRNQPGGLTPYQRQVLSLLAGNLKDEEIAVRTHVSVRTVRRNVAAILDLLGVTTRFAAGVQAAKRAWI